jgi:hypothetical protein
VTPGERRQLQNRVLLVLRRDTARTLEELAGLCGADVKAVKAVVWPLVNTGTLAVVQGWVCFAPPPAKGRVA